MSFRLRLALFIVAILVAIQACTALLLYQVTRKALIEDGQRQLAASADAFVRQLDDISVRVADNVQVLSLDYALRAAIAQRDRDTVLSALRNHGRRIGAARMLLLNLDGHIEADTADVPQVGATFAFPQLANNALERPAAALQQSVELATPTTDGSWRVVASGSQHHDLTAHLQASNAAFVRVPQLIDVTGREFVILTAHLNEAQSSAPVVAVMGYSLDEALEPYRDVGLAWFSLLGVGLLVGLCGAILIARGVSQPIETLATAARRIAGGDYATPPALPRRDEIGELSTAFASMTRAIGEREERIRFQAGHDAVTGLPNRDAVAGAIQQQLAASSAPAGALLMIALGRLPEIVKTMGHSIADRVMRDASERLRLPAGGGTLARAADSEFALWLTPCNRDEAISAAFRQLDALNIPYQDSDFTVDLGPSVGIALFPTHGKEASVLLQRAEVALFAALSGEELVAVYDPATDPHRPERLSLMADLREAIDAQQLRLNYQPKLQLASGAVDGVEGLVRWQHRRLGFIPPDNFIVLAEETGNVRRLTRWALAAGIAQAKAWVARGWNLRTAINLSVRDLDDNDLPQRVMELLSIHGLSAERIALEVTESAVMGKPDAAIQVLRRLADMGIDLAIDDFGVGQSSFAYLRRLPVRELKIDKTFISKLGQDREDQTIVRSIVELGHRLGYRVTAEGVEDRGALDYLAAVGCDHAQGYYIGKAVTPDELEPLLGHERWRLHGTEEIA